MSEFEQHNRLVGILHLVWAGFAIVGVGAGTILLAGIGLLPGVLDETWLPLAITTTIALLIAGVILLFFLPSLMGGIGILRHRPWGRTWLTIAAILNLIIFPLGTALGLYTLWVTWPRVAGDVTISGA